tara:strand:- start:79 stop:309 length:231 start_codon:yes stop_codon:yes gene_type:complete
MKIVGISLLLLMGGVLSASEKNDLSSDEYYGALDLEGFAVAEYNAKGKFDNGGAQEVYRKRSHRRKRIIRPPARGK